MNIIAVASGKGGTGKSCVAAYTGLALAQRGKKTLLLELGGDTRSLDIILGISDTSIFSIQDVAKGLCSLSEAVTPTAYHENLHLIPCSPVALDPGSVAESFESIVEQLNADFDYDYAVLDGADFTIIPPASPDVIINVANPETMGVRAAAALTQSLRETGARDIRLILNNVPSQILPMSGISDFDDIIDMVAARLLAVIPASPKLRYASNNTAALAEDSLTPQVFECVAARLEGENRPLLIR